MKNIFLYIFLAFAVIAKGLQAFIEFIIAVPLFIMAFIGSLFIKE